MISSYKMLPNGFRLLLINTLYTLSFATNYVSYYVPSQVYYMRPGTSFKVGNQMPPHPEPDAVLINGNNPGGPGVFGQPGGVPGVFGQPGGPGVFGQPGGPGVFGQPSGPGVFGQPGGGPGVYGQPGGPGIFRPPSGGPGVYDQPGVFGHPGRRAVFGLPNGGPGIFGQPGIFGYPPPGPFRHMHPPQPEGFDQDSSSWRFNNGYRPHFPDQSFVPNRGNSDRTHPGHRNSHREVSDSEPTAEMFPLIDNVP